MTVANVKSTWTGGNLRFGQKYANGTANVQFDSVPLALSGDYSLTGFNSLSSRYELSWAAGRRGKPGINADIQNAAERGIIIADTKFEFGLDADDTLYLMDEVLTADSSRFWPADQYQVGRSPPSFDKQFVRDYLETLAGWGKCPPAPPLPAQVVAQTADKYREALWRLTGERLG